MTTPPSLSPDQVTYLREVLGLNAIEAALSDIQSKLWPPPDEPAPAEPTTAAVPVPPGWTVAQQYTFATLDGVHAMQSDPIVNAAAAPDDNSNKPLQTPTLRSNVLLAQDADAENGTVLQVWTRPATYPLSGRKTGTGQTNGRCQIGDPFPIVGGTLVQFRSKSIGDGKSAEMIWPANNPKAGGGKAPWKWELDVRERFAGGHGPDSVSGRFHHQQGTTPGATPQIVVPESVDPYSFHVWGIEFTGPSGKPPTGMRATIDGTAVPIHMPNKGPTVTTLTDPAWLPLDPSWGVLSIGKAIPGPRGRADNATHADAVVWDYAQVLVK